MAFWVVICCRMPHFEIGRDQETSLMDSVSLVCVIGNQGRITRDVCPTAHWPCRDFPLAISIGLAQLSVYAFLFSEHDFSICYISN